MTSDGNAGNWCLSPFHRIAILTPLLTDLFRLFEKLPLFQVVMKPLFDARLSLPLLVAGCALLPWSGNVHAQSGTTPTLTPEQISNIRAQLEEIQMVIDGHVSNLNQSAGSVFRQAAQDPKAAAELYARCHKMVNYDRKEREESEYREWEDAQKERFRDPRFLEGLMMQLHYLSLSCEAAEAADLTEVFPSILAYVDSLTRLTELPGQHLLQGVDASVFADAYQLKELLSRNDSWEMVPFNIGGIYEKTILPYLRDNDPSRLVGAWDKRIEQETQMVMLLSSLEEKGNNRDERRQAEARNRQLEQGRTGGLIRAYDEFDFRQKTLPQLQWGKLRDMAVYVDPVQGVAGMLSFVKANTEHPNVQDWLDDLEEVVEKVSGGSSGTTSTTTSSIPATPAPAATTPPAATPPTGTAPTGIPVGLE